MSVGLSVMRGAGMARMARVGRVMGRHAGHVFHVVKIPMRLRESLV